MREVLANVGWTDEARAATACLLAGGTARAAWYCDGVRVLGGDTGWSLSVYPEFLIRPGTDRWVAALDPVAT